MGRRGDIERPRYAEKVRAYLRRHDAGDVAARDLSLEAIARGAGVSRTPMSAEAATCPIISLLLAEVGEARRRSRGGAPKVSSSAPAAGAPGDLGATPAPLAAEQAREGGAPIAGGPRKRAESRPKPGLELLDDRAIARRIQDCRRLAERAMRDWVARHGGGAPADDIALARHDLELVLWSLRRVADDLGPLVDLRDQRSAATSALAPSAGVTQARNGLLDL